MFKKRSIGLSGLIGFFLSAVAAHRHQDPRKLRGPRARGAAADGRGGETEAEREGAAGAHAQNGAGEQAPSGEPVQPEAHPKPDALSSSGVQPVPQTEPERSAEDSARQLLPAVLPQPIAVPSQRLAQQLLLLVLSLLCHQRPGLPAQPQIPPVLRLVVFHVFPSIQEPATPAHPVLAGSPSVFQEPSGRNLGPDREPAFFVSGQHHGQPGRVRGRFQPGRSLGPDGAGHVDRPADAAAPTRPAAHPAAHVGDSGDAVQPVRPAARAGAAATAADAGAKPRLVGQQPPGHTRATLRRPVSAPVRTESRLVVFHPVPLPQSALLVLVILLVLAVLQRGALLLLSGELAAAALGPFTQRPVRRGRAGRPRGSEQHAASRTRPQVRHPVPSARLRAQIVTNCLESVLFFFFFWCFGFIVLFFFKADRILFAAV